jgi:transposase InsO family protein
MNFILRPFHLVVLAVASALNHEQEKIIEYLKAENGVLREQLRSRGGRIRFTDKQRCRLAAAAKALGRRVLRMLGTIVTPDSLLRWNRQLIAHKYDTSSKRDKAGRPRIMKQIEDLVVRISKQNLRWGYTRIRGALWNLGHDVARTTIANILGRHGIEPAPERRRKTTWRQFLQAHWDVMAAADFFTTEVWSPVGLVRYHVFFVIKLATRQVEVAGVVRDPHGAWMEQIARNLTDAFDGFLSRHRYLICDRDPLFTKAFRGILAAAGVQALRLPPRSPNLNAFAERFVLSMKSECLNHLILFSKRQLTRAVTQYVAHYHEERNHQGLDNALLVDDRPQDSGQQGKVVCNERLGGLLRFYHRRAA